MSGKKHRLAKILDKKGGKSCIIPIDHGTKLGPMEGIENSFKAISNFINGGASAIVLHKGILKMVSNYPELLKTNYLMHLSVSTCLGRSQSHKVIVGNVEEAIRLGAIGISIHTNLEGEYETEMIKDLGRIAEECYKWEMPLLSMIYVDNEKENPQKIAHAARLAQELGADIVKVDYPGTIEGFKKVLNGVQIPVLIAGGGKSDNPKTFLKVVNDAMKAGASGISAGRNIFQYEYPELLTRIICNLIEGKWELDECFKHLNGELVKMK